MAGTAQQIRLVPRRTLLQIFQYRRRAFQEEHDHSLGDIGPPLAMEMTQTFEDDFIYRCFAPMRRRRVARVFWMKRQLSIAGKPRAGLSPTQAIEPKRQKWSGSRARSARTCPNRNRRGRPD